MSEKVKAIKEAIKNGTYKCDIETTAEKIVLLASLDLF
jgi:anti-sigma28 factor (negative regulator of flagellin synthesis)